MLSVVCVVLLVEVVLIVVLVVVDIPGAVIGIA